MIDSRKVRKRESAEKSPGLRLGQLEIWGGIHCAEQCPKKGMMVRGNIQVGFNGTLEAQFTAFTTQFENWDRRRGRVWGCRYRLNCNKNNNDY